MALPYNVGCEHRLAPLPRCSRPNPRIKALERDGGNLQARNPNVSRLVGHNLETPAQPRPRSLPRLAGPKKVQELQRGRGRFHGLHPRLCSGPNTRYVNPFAGCTRGAVGAWGPQILDFPSPLPCALGRQPSAPLPLDSGKQAPAPALRPLRGVERCAAACGPGPGQPHGALPREGSGALFPTAERESPAAAAQSWEALGPRRLHVSQQRQLPKQPPPLPSLPPPPPRPPPPPPRRLRPLPPPRPLLLHPRT